jgi:hypothetical protein
MSNQPANIVAFRRPKSKASKRSQQAETLRALASTVLVVNEICASKTISKEALRQAVLLLDIANTYSQLVIEDIDNEEAKVRLLAESACIEKMLETARRSVAALSD